MYDPRQIGAQVWEHDHGGDLIRGGTVVAYHAEADEVTVVTQCGRRSTRKGPPVPFVDTCRLAVNTLDPAMTAPADARMADRVTIARHLFACIGASKDRTRRDWDDTALGWASALWADPVPVRYANAAADTLVALEDAFRDDVPDDDELLAHINDVMPDGVTVLAGTDGAILVARDMAAPVDDDLEAALAASIDAHRARRAARRNMPAASSGGR